MRNHWRGSIKNSVLRLNGDYNFARLFLQFIYEPSRLPTSLSLYIVCEFSVAVEVFNDEKESNRLQSWAEWIPRQSRERNGGRECRRLNGSGNNEHHLKFGGIGFTNCSSVLTQTSICWVIGFLGIQISNTFKKITPIFYSITLSSE